MTRDLHEKLGAVTPENLIAQLDPPALKRAGAVPCWPRAPALLATASWLSSERPLPPMKP